MILGVIGSRSFNNFKYLEEVIDKLKEDREIEEITSGGAKGADLLGEKYARKNNIKTRIFLPEFQKYKHAYHHRNRLIAEHCDTLLAFWDGTSTGTKYTIDYARRLDREVIIERFK